LWYNLLSTLNTQHQRCQQLSELRNNTIRYQVPCIPSLTFCVYFLNQLGFQNQSLYVAYQLSTQQLILRIQLTRSPSVAPHTAITTCATGCTIQAPAPSLPSFYPKKKSEFFEHGTWKFIEDSNCGGKGPDCVEDPEKRHCDINGYPPKAR
jgi:hypothetical protein